MIRIREWWANFSAKLIGQKLSLGLFCLMKAVKISQRESFWQPIGFFLSQTTAPMPFARSVIAPVLFCKSSNGPQAELHNVKYFLSTPCENSRISDAQLQWNERFTPSIPSTLENSSRIFNQSSADPPVMYERYCKSALPGKCLRQMPPSLDVAEWWKEQSLSRLHCYHSIKQASSTR